MTDSDAEFSLDFDTENTEPLHDPVASGSNIIQVEHAWYNENDERIGSLQVHQPSGMRLKIEREHYQIASGSVLRHVFCEKETNTPIAHAQYTWDSKDNHPRVEVTSYPELSHRGKSKKWHPSTESIIASGSSGCTDKTQLNEWVHLD